MKVAAPARANVHKVAPVFAAVRALLLVLQVLLAVVASGHPGDEYEVLSAEGYGVFAHLQP